MSKGEDRTEPSKLELDRDVGLPELAHMLVQTRASVDALAVLIVEAIADANYGDTGEVGQRYDSLKADFALKHAQTLRENAASRKQEVASGEGNEAKMDIKP